MTLYPRRDFVYVAVSGGCGASHTRTVTLGEPDQNWSLNCPQCEPLLDNDPGWAKTRAEIPETPDEITKRENLQNQKDRSLEQIQTAALARIAGIDAPELGIKQQASSAVCSNSHLNASTAKFCSECGEPMRFLPKPPEEFFNRPFAPHSPAADVPTDLGTGGAGGGGGEWQFTAAATTGTASSQVMRGKLSTAFALDGNYEAGKLAKLPVAELRQLAEKRGISPKQSKRQLIEALSSA